MTSKNTPETVGNQFGYLCPVCGKGDGLRYHHRFPVAGWHGFDGQ